MPAASAPVVQHVAERGELIHDAMQTAVIFVLPLDVGQTVELLGGEHDAVLDELRLTERFEFFLGGKSFTVGSITRLVHENAPGLFQVVQEEDQQRVGERKRQRSTEGHHERVQVTAEVHAVGDVIDVSAVPRLVVVG
ncbi:MAG: hypothetical protein JWL75_117 [Parcubacteria group bacterium]|nr:hypothetical protein [Parcubacteria group bacterium]